MSIVVKALGSSWRVGRRDPELVWLAVRATVLLVVARGIISLLPMRRITRLLGARDAETPTDGLSEAQRRHARRVGWVIRKVAPHTPTTSNCYPQGLVAHYLLRRRGIPVTVYYGAAFEPTDTALQTHVWVRSGPIYVTGGSVRHGFGVLASFAHPGGRPRQVSDPIQQQPASHR